MASSDIAGVIEVRIPTAGGAVLDGVAAVPEGDGPHAGVLVISDALGMTNDLRRTVARLAGQGYAAIAPDMYSHGPKVLCVSRMIFDIATRAHGTTTADLDASVAHLAGMPGVDGDRMAVLGFCMGGGFALGFAAVRPAMKACANNYGAVPKARDELADVCPVIGNYGELDTMFTKQARRLDEHLSALGIPHDIKVFPGIGHSFMNDHAGERKYEVMSKGPNPLHAKYDADAAADAWERIFAFFAEHV